MLRFVHISDTHVYPDPDYIEDGAVYPSIRVLESLVSQIKALPFTPDFILHTGDTVYRAMPEAYATLARTMAQVVSPVLYVRGNLDDTTLMQQILLNRSEEAVQPFLFYEVEINGVQLVILDSNGPAPRPAGSLTDAQLAWLEERCAATDERPLVIALHHNPVSVGVEWLDKQMRVTNGDTLHRIIQSAGKRLRGVFHGHIHQALDVIRDGIFYSSTASSGFQFQGFAETKLFDLDAHFLPSYSVVTINRDQTFVRRCLVML